MLLLLALLLVSCATNHEVLYERYIAEDKSTALIFHPDGSFEVEELEGAKILFPAGDWKREHNVVFVDSLGEKLKLEVTNSKGKSRLVVTNSQESPNTMATWRLSKVYLEQ